MSAASAFRDRTGLSLPPGVARHVGLLSVLLLIGLFTSLNSEVFLTTPNLVNVSQQVAVVAVLAAGLTLLMTAGGIDFSLGAIAAVSHAVVAKLIQGGMDEWAAVLVALALGTAIGLVNGGVVTVFSVAPFVATLASSTILTGVALLLLDGMSVSIGDHLAVLGFGELFGAIPSLVVLAVLVCLAVGVLMRWSAFGRNAFAIGGNESAARLSGIPVVRSKLLLYALGGFLAALGGVMLVARLGAASPGTGGLPLELTVVAAVVIGGTSLHGGSGTLVGTVLGVLLLGLVANSLNLLQIDPVYQDIAVGTVLMIAAIVNHQRGRRT
ncbi:ABC transporter permease [Streptomyces sp. NPDC002490]|uniref:ABC transporter permease n=1 Tax=Streptomyces sp. NPDC002490 TaxID=3154416 RepID=UPI003330622A